MGDMKIYVVLNIDNFKKLCEEKLGENITADDFIALESLKKEQVHLVPKFKALIEKYYIRANSEEKSDYDIYIKIKGNWFKKNLIEITERDIKELQDNNTIEDLEEYESWKNTFAYKIIDEDKFNDSILPKLTDEEIIAYSSILSRFNNENNDIFLINYNDRFKIFVRDAKINQLQLMPYNTLNKEDLLDFIKRDIIQYSKCRINEEKSLIKLDENTYFYTLSRRFAYGNRFLRQIRDGKYVARAFCNDKFNNKRVIHAFGETEREAKEKLREKICLIMGHRAEDTKKTMKVYEELMDKDDYDI